MQALYRAGDDRMNIQTVDLLKLQTKWMQDDTVTKGLCAALTPQLQSLAEKIIKALGLPLVTIDYTKLTEEVMDQLALDLLIAWYDSGESTETKAKVIKNADRLHSIAGTPAAIEEVMQIYFGDGEVKEWFDYGGNPGYFKVVTSNVSVTGEKIDEFLAILESIKRASAWLEEVVIAMSGEFNINYGFAVHTGDFLNIRQVV